MALADTLSGTATLKLVADLIRTSGTKDNVTGRDTLSHKYQMPLTDGSGANQAVGFFGATFTATTGGITVSLADSADPLAAAGDDIPSSDPEGKKLKAIMIENEDATNYVSVKKGTNGEASIFDGSTDSLMIHPGGCFIWIAPSGSSAMTDGTDDELTISANTASCVVKISYVFG